MVRNILGHVEVAQNVDSKSGWKGFTDGPEDGVRRVARQLLITAVNRRVGALLDEQGAEEIRDVRFLLDDRRRMSGGAFALRQLR